MRRNWAKPVFGLVISCLFLYLLIRDLDMAKIHTAFVGISTSSVLVALLMLTLGYMLRIIRWWVMMYGLEKSLSVRDCARPFLISISVNALLPLRAGDLLRVFGFRKQLRVPAMKILATLLIERLLDLMVLLGCFFCALLLVPTDNFPALFVTSAIWIAALGAVSVLTLLLFSKQLYALFAWFLGWNAIKKFRFITSLLHQAEHFFQTFDILAKHRLLSQLIILSILVWIFEGAVFISIAYGLNIQTSIIGVYFSMSTGTLATLLPSSPGYFGTFDYFTRFGLEVFGVQRELATAYALAVHVILWLPLVLVGMLFYLKPGNRSGTSQPSELKRNIGDQRS